MDKIEKKKKVISVKGIKESGYFHCYGKFSLSHRKIVFHLPLSRIIVKKMLKYVHCQVVG